MTRTITRDRREPTDTIEPICCPVTGIAATQEHHCRWCRPDLHVGNYSTGQPVQVAAWVNTTSALPLGSYTSSRP